MTRIELDDQILNHDKFIRLGRVSGGDAIWLWLGLRAYCSQKLSDGFIPDDMLDEVRGPKDPKVRAKCLQALKDQRLLEDRDGGVYLHDYLDHSSSREQVETWRRKARERKASSRGMSQRDSVRDSHGDSSGSLGVGSLKVTDTHARKGEGVGDQDLDLQGSPEGGAGFKSPGLRFAESFEFECPETIEFSDKNKRRASKCGKPIAELFELYRAKQLKLRAKFCNETAVQVDFDAWLLNYYDNHKDDPGLQRAPKLPQSKSSEDIEAEAAAARAQRDRDERRRRPTTNEEPPVAKTRPGATSAISTTLFKTVSEAKPEDIEAKRRADLARLAEFEKESSDATS